ncbi:hypothetical protein F444_21321 [Phytophthora nicotianae P1976]|uniref:Uncharacterized protein n=1 Tax=Phytophthora nicotianae P1976 TaxID=1317066 RepID=A0A080Z1H7_PHYNI|nr:hypothetical protein F444_21321 [Phytophthora nicotianae P1976]
MKTLTKVYVQNGESSDVLSLSGGEADASEKKRRAALLPRNKNCGKKYKPLEVYSFSTLATIAAHYASSLTATPCT